MVCRGMREEAFYYMCFAQIQWRIRIIQSMRTVMRLGFLLEAFLLMASAVACSRAPQGGGASPEGPQTVARPGYVGTAACVKCHAIEAQKFAESDHVRAQALPTAQTVKGDFGGVSFDHLGVVSRFEKEGEKYFVTT